MFLYGIEHEIALWRTKEDVFADFSNTSYEEIAAIIAELPMYEADYQWLRVGGAGFKVKRWHSEGFERHSEQGKLLRTVPKGVEIRIPPKASIEEVITELEDNFARFESVAKRHGFMPVWTSFNPWKTQFMPDPPLNSYEIRLRGNAEPELQGESVFTTMLTYGPDINLSSPAFSDDEQLIEIGKKLTYYSPFIVPFSFSSPFYGGKLWDGLSVRTYCRTGLRPAAMVFLYDEANLLHTSPSLTQASRMEKERGRIEFKAFDAVSDPRLYGSLFALIQGIALDTTLGGRRLTPDKELHQLAAKEGFSNELLRDESKKVLVAATAALQGTHEARYLEPLFEVLEHNHLPVHKLIDHFRSTGDLEHTLKHFPNLVPAW